MTLERYVPTRALQQAAQGREMEVLEALKIAWQDGTPHIRCPYPNHSDDHPSWRWDEPQGQSLLHLHQAVRAFDL